MNRSWIAVLIAVAAGSCTIPIDPRARSIPTEVAVTKLQELLPRADYVSFLEPRVGVLQSDLRNWKVDSTGMQFESVRNGSFRLAWSDNRGVELVKVPLRYELRLFATAAGSRRKEVLHINFTAEDDARRTAELFEALRGDY